MIHLRSKRKILTIFLLVSLSIVVASVLFTNSIAKQLQSEEKKKIELWAEATRQVIMADENTDLLFVSSIIEENTTIPAYVVDADDNVLITRNVREPKTNPEAFYKKKIQKLKDTQEPIVMQISDDTVQYIYYEDSILLTRLQVFPYIEFSLIFLVIVIVLLALQTVQRSQQNMVWVGLSKETAHQLGTPISSLNAWLELMKANYPDEMMVEEMEQDVNRLQVIAERFSKIGSEAELTKVDLTQAVSEVVEYMRHRVSSNVEIIFSASDHIEVMANQPLLGWVVENMIKNSVDAMGGEGKIEVVITSNDNHAYIDISDNGKGIERSVQSRIFEPGYTTKQRGWGLGLSLAKRIVDDYHKGKLSLRSSQVGIGTTFRITLPKTRS